MLAGPRRKQKVINLRAKNNAWSNDTNKFGQKMLEKMGWSAGKGLGAKENGIVEHVVAKYKNDEKGLGFEDKNDQWTKHEDDFNALLANLSNCKYFCFVIGAIFFTYIFRLIFQYFLKIFLKVMRIFCNKIMMFCLHW